MSIDGAKGEAYGKDGNQRYKDYLNAMELTHLMRTGVITAVFFLVAAAFLGGNPHQSFAEPLGSDIVCHVFTTLTNLGDPIPVLTA